MKSKTYAEKINEICDYIYSNLDKNLSIDHLSEVGSFSKYHFHRQFFGYTGINVFKFIQLLRLKKASYQLFFNKDYKIIDIAFDACFENPESFSRAFKNTFGQTPSEFRKKPKWEPWHEKYNFPIKGVTKEMKVEIIEFKEKKVAVLEHKGAVELLNNSVSKFIEWRKSSKLSPVQTKQTYGIPYSDPKTTKPEEFRFDICGEVSGQVPQNKQGVINKTIPEGLCAVTRHLGSHETMDEKVHYLYGEWLPNSNEELRDFPVFFHYLNLFPEVEEHELITDIYLPLK